MATPNPASAAIVMDGKDTGTGGTLFLASTPLHTFLALGLMAGPLSDRPRRLWLIDQPAGARDCLGDAVEASPSLAVQVQRFAALRGTGPARAELRRISALVAKASPETLAVGMDHRLEFHAAVRGCPQAKRVYIDDGLYSYLPHQHAVPAWQERLSNWRRGWKYGLPVERPSLVGGSRAVQSAYVLLPDRVHAGLAGKPVQAYRPEWFAGDEVRRVCVAAAGLAGLDAAHCADWRLLLLLPHPRFLAADRALRQQLAALVRRAGADGPVALKSHPNATASAHDQLGLPAHAAAEVPPRLPAEVLVPLLRQTRVVGSLTTALLSLSLLGRGLQVYRLPSPASTSGFEAGAQRVYDAAGVRVFDPAQDG
ncbi:hypothetical protein AACH06_00440 [Ideonella sp. DXS29W]|uniref:Uncharacterized protein n=1 Tax=Ideonella lacteola TaxID=2984193 RepID=A0ABU9BHH8_9BURK